MAVIEEATHWRNDFPNLVAFTMGMVFPRSLTEDEIAPPGAAAGARLPKHVSGIQKFPEITLKLPTKSHTKKYLTHITAQWANQLFDDYTESIQQDWRNTPLQHRNEVWGDTFEALQKFFLQFHELQHTTWTDFHAHTAG
jgi:hypothetical protein